jgi:hypothetical protein
MPPKKILLLFGIVWSSLTCVFLGYLIYGTYNQWRSEWFSSTAGTVEKIEITNNSHSDGGTTQGIDIVYSYHVKGRGYSASQLRYEAGSSNDSWASDMMRQFPAGSHPTVYYNPSNPAEAVLIRGIQGEDLFLALFLTPFTVVMLGIWAAFAYSFRKPTGFSGLRVIEEGTITRIRPAHWLAVVAAAASLGLCAFISMFIVAAGFGGCHPPLNVITVVWEFVLGISPLVGVGTWLYIRSGRRDIILNILGRTVTAPNGIIVPFKEIDYVEVWRKMRDSENKKFTYSYEIWLVYKQGAGSGRLKLKGARRNENSAREFASWIAGICGATVEDRPLPLKTGGSRTVTV